MVIEISDIKKIYGKGSSAECCALNGVSLSIEQGEKVAIVGKSGSGKSTLLHVMGLLDDYDSGSLRLFGKDAASFTEKQKARFRNKNIGFVMQDFALIPDMTVFDNVAIPLYISGEKRNIINHRVMELLTKVDMADKKNNPARMLSGGQKQRIALLRAMIYSPKLLLADEPTGSLDSQTGQEMLKMIFDYKKEETTIVIVTHDMDIAKQCDRMIQLEDGKIL